MKKGFSKRVYRLLSAAVILAVWMLLCGFVSAKSASQGGSRLKAVTYFGNEWPINFWNGEHSQAPEDFKRIKSDGFNSIILVVPWNEFQPSLGIRDFNQNALSKLDTLMDQAASAGLSVVLRLGYTWDYYNNAEVKDRFRMLMYDSDVRDAWKRYAGKIYSIVSKHSNFGGAFITWEDLWSFRSEAAGLKSIKDRNSWSEKTGYAYYLRNSFSEEELLKYYDRSELAALPIPKVSDKAYKLFYDWYDAVLMDVLSDTQEVFPDVSMECRLDMDPVNSDSGYYAYDHSKTFKCGKSSFASIMMSANMGFGSGTVIAPSQAVSHARTEIQRVKNAGKKPVFVDQFLYMESTPGYENIARIDPSNINEYLRSMGDVISAESIGYGIWTYKDYADSIVYNPEFGLKLEGWTADGNVTVEKIDGTNMAKISKGSSLSANLSMRGYLSKKPAKLQFRALSEKPASITVSVGSNITTVNKPAGDKIIELEYDTQVKGVLSFKTDEDLYIDDVKLYSHITEGNIYKMDGSKGDFLQGIRDMNSRIR